MAETYSTAMAGSNGKPVSIPANSAEEIGNRLNDLYSSLDKAADRMQRVLDRAFGSGPTPAETGKAIPREVPAGAIGSITQRLSDLERLAENQHDILNRIDKIV